MNRVPLKNNKGATAETVFKDTIQFTLMYAPFLTSTLHLRTTLINWKVLLENHQLLRDFHTTCLSLPSLSLKEVILASSTPITEHTNLLDQSIRAFILTHPRISHPPKAYWPKFHFVFYLHLSPWVASCLPTFCKKGLSVTSTAKKHLEVNSFQTLAGSSLPPLQTMH